MQTERSPVAQESGPGLLRLMQMADSSFPVGGFAFSHGLEWFVQRGLVKTEGDVAAVLESYVGQVGGGQWLPAALAAARSRTPRALLRCDEALDASIAAEGERNAGRAMGERLLVGAADAFGGERTRAFLAAVHQGETAGQYPVAFGLVAAEQGASEATMLAALGFTMLTSVAQAAIRLGVIGQAAAARLVANGSRQVDATVVRVLARPGRFAPGAFTPGLDVAGLMHPTLTFRMFVS